MIILPGGLGGANFFQKSTLVQSLLKLFNDCNKFIAAICAAPIALDSSGVLQNHTFTCYPGIEKQIHAGTFVDQQIVHSGNIITAYEMFL